MKRMISLLLAAVLVLTLLPALPLRAEARTGGKLVALTFDDGPSSKYTSQLLDGLKERGVPVTFFVLGEMAGYNRSILRRAYEEGHEIACHSWDHPNLTRCTEEEVKRQMEDTYRELDRACGEGAEYLVRPPYGSTNQMVLDAIDAPLIYWSVDSEDWSLLDTAKVRKKIVADAYDGAIILCHDIHKTTIPAALGAIDDLMDLGYEFVTVSELFRRRGRELEDHKLHYNSNKNGIDYGPVPAPEISFSGDPAGINTVTLTCADAGVPLYYTLDGSYPNQTATLYTGPFTVPYGTTVTAVAAWKLNGSRSALTVKTADQIRIVAPSITLDSAGNVVMQTPTVGGEIYYTIDGSMPDANSLRYDGPEAISGGCCLRAVTVREGQTSADTRAYLSVYGDLYYDMFEGDWFYDAMDWAHRSGILNGTALYTMDPAGTVSRGMLVTLLYRFSGDSLGSDWTRTNGFADVDQSYYYAEAIEWAYRNHIVDGYAPDAFGPDDTVTRQQMCKIVASFLRWMDMPLHSAESCAGRFGDYDQVAYWAVESVDSMVAAGLIQGYGSNLNPNDGTNRAQFCVVLTRLTDYIDNYVPEIPEHTHEWVMNLAQDGSDNWAAVTICEGETIELLIGCAVCGETAEAEWIAEPDGVVLVEDSIITGILGGSSALVHTVWAEQEFACMVHVLAEEPPAEHVHSWKLNKAVEGDPTWGEVSIDVGEKFRLRILCTGEGCTEEPAVEWTAEPDGVVLVEENTVTGLLAGKNAWVRAEWEGITYECWVHVRKEAEPTEPDPTEPEHVHSWKLNKSLGGSLTDGDVSIRVGEWFNLRILCTDPDCTENAPVTWTPSREGVVQIEGMKITGVQAGTNTTLTAEWEGVTYSCIVRVRRQTSSNPGAIGMA